jgi:hypothetical protein
MLTQAGLRVATGSSKVGSFVGDHAKIGVGALLNTGTNVGAFAGVLPAGRLLPRYVPSFCNVNYGVLVESEDPEVLFATAQEVMRRRGAALSDAHLEVYRAAFEQTAPQRRDALRASDRPRVRRSA